MDAANIRSLCRGYLAGTLTPEELQAFLVYLNDNSGQEILRDEMLAALQQEKYPSVADEGKVDILLRQLLTRIHEEASEQEVKPVIPTRRSYFLQRRWWAAAAVLLILLGIGIYRWLEHTDKKVVVAGTPVIDIAPGGNKAVLTLSNGSQIVLDNAHNGMLASQGNIKVIKADSGQIVYQTAPDDLGKPAAGYNTLSTPRGGQYQLLLPDGTAVWLNAASSIRYPLAFTGKTREVEITGEAYFEVAPNSGIPFRVKVGGMKVDVLGTHFNIMAYDDEAVVKTTLIEGAISVTQGKERLLVSPGEQAQIDKNGSLRLVNEVDINKVLAWKNHLFWFNNDDIETVMRELSRWYNVDVVIKGNVPLHFTGSLPRNINVSKVFNILQETGKVHFIITDGKLIVSS